MNITRREWHRLTFGGVAAAATGLGLATMGGYLMLDDWTVPLAGAPLPSGLKFLGLALGGVLILIFALERLFIGALRPVRED